MSRWSMKYDKLTIERNIIWKGGVYGRDGRRSRRLAQCTAQQVHCANQTGYVKEVILAI